ncbi:MAG: FAD-binding oxidoreductase [Deltaproteobacteria bacterium]|nr:FAD-binding oxidoreductase [Deltaproteobacteria bacterium]
MKLITKVIPEPTEVYKPSNPFKAKVIENKRLTPVESEEDIRHIVFDLSGSGISYLEGQSLGIQVPGVDEHGKKNRIRLYSIASSRKGDDGLSSTVSLCVKRVMYKDDQGVLQKGLTSNYVCDLMPSDAVYITGPAGRKLLLPADNSVHLIMLAVGTGIAPFRAFIQHIYREKGSWGGKVRLFFGAKTGLESIYMNQENNDIGQYYTQETFLAFQALSREEKTKDGNKFYVQNRLEENEKEIWEIIKEGHFCFYICGLKGLESGAEEVLDKWAKKDGLNWNTMKAEFVEQGRWNIEVY